MKLPWKSQRLSRLFSSSALICAEAIILCILGVSLFIQSMRDGLPWPPKAAGMDGTGIAAVPAEESYIKWVDFNVTSQALTGLNFWPI